MPNSTSNKILVLVENTKKQSIVKSAVENDSHYIIEKTEERFTRIADSKSPFGWRVSNSTQAMIDRLQLIAKDCDKVYLAMDDDDEGERFAWDIMECLKHTKTYRVAIRDLSPSAIKNALTHEVRHIDQHLINGYLARKMVEGMVSKNISEMMQWYFKKEGLVQDTAILENIGIGRVSASALALIMEAEEKIDVFIQEYYKRVSVDYFYNNASFTVRNKLKFTNEKKEELLAFMELTRREKHIIKSFEKKTKDKVPPSPLNAIKLQNDANYQFQYTSKEVAVIAKELYDGVKINGKIVSLITYPKTNSIFIKDETAYEIIQYILDKYGENYLFTTKRVYKNSEKNTSQEAIRPVSFEKEFEPTNLKDFLTEEQYRIYDYIFQRTIATQMTSAVYDQSEVVIDVSGTEFKTIANKLLFDGWRLIGKTWRDDFEESGGEVVLPEQLVPGDEIIPLDIYAYEVKERMPWRYGEGRFITTLAKYNIANVSFVSEIVNFLLKKDYIEIMENMLYPKLLGRRVFYFLKLYAPWLIDLEFVAKFENDIERVALGEKKKEDILSEYKALLNETIVTLGYGNHDEKPENWMIEKATRISKQNNVPLPDGALESKKKTLSFIKQNKQNSTEISKCPFCSNGDVYVTENAYKCNNPKCSFILWFSNVDRFLSSFSKNIPLDTFTKYVQIIFNKGKCFIDGLYSSKKEKFFDSYISIDYNEKYKNYELVFVSNELKEGEKKTEYLPEINFEQAEEIKTHDTEKENEVLKKKLVEVEEERRFIKDESKKDPLTRAFNRRCFDEDISKLINTNEKENLSLAFIDGDKFKDVNDTYGHQAGDKVLQAIVDIMFQTVSSLPRARVYRYGGEEFLILFVGVGKKEVLECLNKLRNTIENTPVVFDNSTISFTISSGVSFCSSVDSVASFVERADSAVYKAKENGRNRIEVGVS